MKFSGWMLPDAERAKVLSRFPTRYADAKASHVTRSLDDDSIPEDAEIIAQAYVNDGNGIEALVVRVNGEVRRPDGLVYHLTLSVGEGRSSKDSNDVIASPFHKWCELLDEFRIETRGCIKRGEVYVTTPLSGELKL